MSDDQEKTEEATQTRRDEFRKRGEVAQTRELATVMMLFGSAISLYALSRFFLGEFAEIFNFAMGDGMVEAVRRGSIFPVMSYSFGKMALILSPVLLLVAIIGFCSTVFQVGFLSVENALTPNFQKIDPLQGAKRMFSLKSLVEAAKSLLKISFVMLVAYFILKDEVNMVPQMSHLSVSELFTYMGSITFKLLLAIGFVMTIIGVADYAFQRYDIEQKMKMSKQEIKEEHKSREGDPMIKARIKRVQREMANKRMMQDIPKADVIVTNPTHIAIALKYDGNMPAPQIIGKGADIVAERIKEIAREHNIPVIENKPLARTIYKTLKIGHFIPRELFVSVAEILSYVYRLKRRSK